MFRENHAALDCRAPYEGQCWEKIAEAFTGFPKKECTGSCNAGRDGKIRQTTLLLGVVLGAYQARVCSGALPSGP